MEEERITHEDLVNWLMLEGQKQGFISLQEHRVNGILSHYNLHKLTREISFNYNSQVNGKVDVIWLKNNEVKYAFEAETYSQIKTQQVKNFNKLKLLAVRGIKCFQIFLEIKNNAIRVIGNNPFPIDRFSIFKIKVPEEIRRKPSNHLLPYDKFTEKGKVKIIR